MAQIQSKINDPPGLTCLYCCLSSFNLVSHLLNDLRAGTDEVNASIQTGLSKIRPLWQKTITRVDSINIVFLKWILSCLNFLWRNTKFKKGRCIQFETENLLKLRSTNFCREWAGKLSSVSKVSHDMKGTIINHLNPRLLHPEACLEV